MHSFVVTCWLVSGAGGFRGRLTSCEHNSWKRGGSVDASSFGANRVNDLYCLAFKVTEENRSKEALQECKQSHLELQAVSTHC